MKKYTIDEIVRILEAADELISSGCAVGEACHRLRVAPRSYHRWRNSFSGLSLDQAKRLHAMRRENALLRKLSRDQQVDLAIARSAVAGN